MHKRVLYVTYVIFFVASVASTWRSLASEKEGMFLLDLLVLASMVVIWYASRMLDIRHIGDNSLRLVWKGYYANLSAGYVIVMISVQLLFMTIFQFESAVAQHAVEPGDSSDAMSDAIWATIGIVASLFCFHRARKIRAGAKD
jgi:hypothetical protein